MSDLSDDDQRAIDEEEVEEFVEDSAEEGGSGVLRTVAACVVVYLAIRGLVGLFGGDDLDEPRAEPAKAQIPKPPAQPSFDVESARQAVQQYYDDIDLYAYGEAWDALGPVQQAENIDFVTWRDGFDTNVETNLASATPTLIDQDTASVAVQLNTVDIDACDSEVHQTFAGTWTVEFAGGRTILAGADISRVSGSDPVTDPTACAPTEPPVAPPPTTDTSECAGGYSICLSESGDYDCAGGEGDGPNYVEGPVDVTGSDPYGLDANGDGVGCEDY